MREQHEVQSYAISDPILTYRQLTLWTLDKRGQLPRLQRMSRRDEGSHVAKLSDNPLFPMQSRVRVSHTRYRLTSGRPL